MNFNNMTMLELKEIARKNKIRGFSNKNKKQLIALLKRSYIKSEIITFKGKKYRNEPSKFYGKVGAKPRYTYTPAYNETSDIITHIDRKKERLKQLQEEWDKESRWLLQEEHNEYVILIGELKDWIKKAEKELIKRKV